MTFNTVIIWGQHTMKSYLYRTYIAAIKAILAAFFFLTTSSYVSAQDSDDYFALEEVVVTARKREESLQDAPLSIQAFTSHSLEQRNVTDISQLGEFTPNMKFDRAAAIGGSNSSAVVYIRGIGQESGLPTIDQGVGMYIDGVYMARSVGGVFDLVDVERVEVVRGPQGTLFGRNTIGGAISITTKKPSKDFFADTALTLGTDGLAAAKVTLNGALTDNFYASAALISKQRDGYVVRPDGTDFGDEDVQAGRLALRWEASDKAIVDLSIDATNSESNGAAWTLVDVDSSALFPTFYNAALAPPVAGCFDGLTGMSTNSTNTACYNENWVPDDLDKDNGGLTSKDELEAYGTALTVSYDLADNLTLKSITAYRDSSSDFNIDQDHSPLVIAHVESESSQNQFTQELQFLGSSNDGSINYILGLYYFEEESHYIEFVTFSPVAITSGGDNKNDSKAVFAQMSYDITDALSLTAGLRYTDDTKRFTPDSVVLSSFIGLPPGTLVLPNEESEISVNETTPMLNLSYRWNEALMTYLTYSEGFKSGGFTQRVFPPELVTPSFAPEFADVTELGFKWQTVDNRLRLNGAYFFTDYKDLQIISQANSVAPIVQNAGAAEIQGIELDLQAVPAENWLLEASLGYLDAEYTELDADTGISLSNKLVKTPELSLVAAIAYTFDLSHGGMITSRIDYSYSDEYYNNAINSEPLKQSSYGLINLGLSFENADATLEVLAYGKNLSDERYVSAGYSEQNGSTLNLGISEVVRDRGREFGVSVKYRFE